MSELTLVIVLRLCIPVRVLDFGTFLENVPSFAVYLSPNFPVYFQYKSKGPKSCCLVKNTKNDHYNVKVPEKLKDRNFLPNAWP